MWISPSFQDTDFKQPLSVDDKITIFGDRTLGWKLDIANQIMNGKKGADGSVEQPPIQHAGYAALDIVISYFEMIAKYEDGFAKAGKSEDYFKSGVYLVFPEFKQPPPPANVPGIQGKVVSLVELVLDLMYEGIRCGLYHSGITNGRIMLTGEIQTPMAFGLQNQILIVNPHMLVPKLIAHLADYIKRLRDVNNADLRAKFGARFDFDTRA
jgi:hypothetical protein